MNSNAQGIDSFLEDIAPFFYQRRITYVDVGAFNGTTFERVLESGLQVREAHLVEPNSRALNRAKTRAAKFTGNSVDYHNMAMGARAGRVRMHAAKTMTRVVSEVDGDAAAPTEDSGLFDVECSTLDLLSASFSEGRVSILKIDVEGFELQVLEGARTLLAEQRADCIYIEAGLSRAGRQQCYYRDIEDALREHGYQIFRIYEQQHEWMEDSPLLRRVNVAFFSRRFAEGNPYRLTRELVQARSELEQLKEKSAGEAATLRAQLDAEVVQEKQLATDVAALDKMRSDAVNEVAALRAQLDAGAVRAEQLAADVAALNEMRRNAANETLALESQIASLRSENKGLAARTSASEAAARDAVNDQGRLRGELRSLATQLAQVTQERQAFQAAVATQSEDFQRYKGTAGKVFDLARDLVQREEKALKQAAKVRNELETLRNRRAFRAAKAVYHGMRSPSKWLGLPVAVWRALREETDITPGRSMPPAAVPLTMLADKKTLTLPLSRAPRFAVLEAGGGVHTIYCRAYSSKGGLASTVQLEVSAADASGDDLLHIAAIGGSPLGAGARQGQTLRAHVRLAADRDTPLIEFAESRARVRISVARPQGDFAVLILSRNGALAPRHDMATP